MNIFKRIGRLLRMLVGIFLENTEDAVPLERRLAFDRQERAQKLKKMMDKATDVGQAAEYMVQGLAEARIVASNISNEIRGYLQAAKEAQARGDKAAEEDALASAASLSDELAEAKGDVEELEGVVDSSLKDKEAAKQMVLQQARRLQHLARDDSRLVAKVRMAQMKQESLELRESLMDLVPEDMDNFRQRARAGADKTMASVKSRSELVDALWQQNRRGQIAHDMQTSARGTQILRQMQEEVGYQPTAAAKPVEEESQEVESEASA